MLNYTFVFYYSNIKKVESIKRSLTIRNKCEKLDLAYVGHGNLDTIIKYGKGYFDIISRNTITNAHIIVVMDKVEAIVGFEDFELINYEDFISYWQFHPTML